MKRRYAGILFSLSFIVALTGCASSGSLIKSYSDTILSDTSSIVSSNQIEATDFMATSLVIFPKEGASLSVPESAEETGETQDSEYAETESGTEDGADPDMETEETGGTQAPEEAQEELQLESGAALLAGIDSLEGLYAKNIYERRAPASLTKLMTALLVLENCDFNEEVTFTEDMVVTEPDASLCYLEVGDVLTVKQLFYGLMIQSGNDAANALAIHVAGSIEAFCDMMNVRAKELGCADTHFVNPNGLHDDDHYTSAYDIYLMLNECLKHEDFITAIRQTEYTAVYENASKETVSMDYTTTNQYFLDYYDYPPNVKVIGGKTGTTNEAGRCLALYVTNDSGQGFISIILGAWDGDMLYSEMNELLNKIPN